MIYLASPYSSPDPAVRQWRYEAACRATARLLKSGLMVFSPVVHSHPLAAFGLDAMDHGFWMRVDRPYLGWCAAVKVLTLPGWEASRGVADEIAIARAAGKPVGYLLPAAAGIEIPEADACL